MPIVVVAIAMNLANGWMGQVALRALVHAHWGVGGYGALLASWAFITGGCAISLVPYLGGEAGAAAALLIQGGCSSRARPPRRGHALLPGGTFGPRFMTFGAVRVAGHVDLAVLQGSLDDVVAP